MKKIASILLAVAMICSMMIVLPFSASAADPEGTAITDAAGFAAMTADGKYYLANDITVDATWGASVDAETGATTYATFAGTFDGNGKTITVSAPLFGSVGSATIKNFTVKGTLSGEVDLAAVAVRLADGANATFDGIVSEVDITVTTKKDGAAILATAPNFNSTTALTVTNCVNKGDITAGWRTAGIVGNIYCTLKDAGTLTVTIKNCVNEGAITSTQSYAGGIIGRFGGDRGKGLSADNVINVENCENKGEIRGFTDQIGGILGYGACSTFNITACVNNGKVVAPLATNSLHAGGIVGKVAGPNADSPDTDYNRVNITDCVNNGLVYSELNAADNSGLAEKSSYLGGIAGSLGYSYVNMKNCVNNATIENKVTGLKNCRAGGISGQQDTGAKPSLFYGCVNNGKIIGIGGSLTGGIIGGVTGVDSLTVEYCINNAEVYNPSERAGGIIGNVSSAPTAGFHTIRACANFGKITGGAKYASGIVGYLYGGGVYNTVDACFNAGEINMLATADGNYAAGIVAYVNATKLNITNNANIGNINGVSGYTAEISYQKGGDEGGSKCVSSGHIVLGNIAGVPGNVNGFANDVADECTAYTTADALVAALNAVIGTEVEYEYTVENGVVKLGVPASDTPSAPTGDNAWIYAVVAVVSVLGVAFVAKKRAIN